MDHPFEDYHMTRLRLDENDMTHIDSTDQGFYTIDIHYLFRSIRGTSKTFDM